MILILFLSMLSACAKAAIDDSAATPRAGDVTTVDYTCAESAHSAELHITTATSREWESVTAAISTPAALSNIYIDMLPDNEPNIYSATMSIAALKCNMPVKTEYWLFDGYKYYTFR